MAGETSPIFLREGTIKMNIRQSMKLSAIIDKINVKITNPEASQGELGADLILQIVSGAYKAEKEIYNFIADMSKITPEAAEEMDIKDFIKLITETEGLQGFFTTAAK